MFGIKKIINTLSGKKKEQPVGNTFVINLHPMIENDEALSTAWFVYASTKSQWLTGEYFTKHPNIPEQDRQSALELEFYARQDLLTVWEVLSHNGEPQDDYLGILSRVHKAGFLREYIWTFLNQAKIEPSQKLKLDEFQTWCEKHQLINHQAETLAMVFKDKNSPQFFLEKLPKKIGAFKKEARVMIYNEPELGASIGYNKAKKNNKQVTMTVYLYDLGYPEIPTGLKEETFNQAKMDMKENPAYQQVIFDKDQQIQLTLKNSKQLNIYTTTAQITSNKLNHYSVLFITEINQYLFKMRVTSEKPINFNEIIEILNLMITDLNTN